MRELATRHWALRNWFVLVLPILVLASLQFGTLVDWRTEGRIAEAVTLFDWCVSVPLLYYLCYRSQLSARQMALRLLALACSGVWFATWLVPQSSQSMLPSLSWARMAGIAIIAAVELRLIVAAVRVAFSDNATTEQLTRASGAPPLIAKLILLEARFWRAVWRFLKPR